MDQTQRQHRFRFIMLGDDAVGKTSMLKRYTEGQFQQTKVTIGVDFCMHTLEVEPGVKVNLELFDTPGHKLCRSSIRPLYQNSVGVVLVFDVGNHNSFEGVREWHADVLEHVQNPPVFFVLVGHKSDLKTAGKRVVAQEHGEELAKDLGAMYVEASAKTGQDISVPFELLSRRVYQGLLAGEVHLREGWRGVNRSVPHSQKTNQQNTCCVC